MPLLLMSGFFTETEAGEMTLEDAVQPDICIIWSLNK